MIYRIATEDDLENVWNKDIASYINDERWVRWKSEYIEYNKLNMAKTFVAVDGVNVIAQITLVLSSKVKAVLNKPLLCNDYDIANFNAFRCDEKYRGSRSYFKTC